MACLIIAIQGVVKAIKFWLEQYKNTPMYVITNTVHRPHFNPSDIYCIYWRLNLNCIFSIYDTLAIKLHNVLSIANQHASSH